MSRIFNLFISHSWSYGDAYDKLIAMLKEKPYFQFRDYSVPRDDPIHDAPNSQALYAAIQQQMKPCHVILVMAGKYATYSTWINKEMKIAKDFGKPILAIAPWGAQQISSVVRENADEIVRWNAESIVSAIRKWAL